MREADYVVNQISNIKRELSTQGDQLEFARVKEYLFDKWQFWHLKLHLMVSTCLNSLEMNLLSDSVFLLSSYYKELLGDLNTIPSTMTENQVALCTTLYEVGYQFKFY